MFSEITSLVLEWMATVAPCMEQSLRHVPSPIQWQELIVGGQWISEMWRKLSLYSSQQELTAVRDIKFIIFLILIIRLIFIIIHYVV